MLPIPAITRNTKPVVTTVDPEFVMHDTALCSFPGLFRNTDEWSFNSLTALKLVYECGPMTFEVHNSELLGGHELAILQVIGGYAARNGETLRPADLVDSESVNRDLLDALPVPDPGSHNKSVKPEDLVKPLPVTEAVRKVDLSDTRLLKLLGYPVCAEYRKIVQDALLRLANVSIMAYPNGQRRLGQPMHLIARVANKTLDADVARRNECGHIAINPRLTKIFLQLTKTRHTYISLKETQALGTDQVARILHQRLANWIKDGGVAVVTYRRLLSYVFPVYPGHRNELPDPAGVLVDAYRRSKEGDQVRDPVFARKSEEQIKSERLVTVIKALNKLKAHLGWELTLSSDLDVTPLAADATSEEQNQHAERHAQLCKAAKSRAARDVYETAVQIRRVTRFIKTKRDLLEDAKKSNATPSPANTEELEPNSAQGSAAFEQSDEH